MHCAAPVILDRARERAHQLGLRGAALRGGTHQRRGVLGVAGRRAPPRSTSTPTSPMPWSGTSGRPATPYLRSESAWSCCWRRRGCFFRLASSTPMANQHRRRHRTDDYSAIADNNVYTNLLAQQNLRCAADTALRYPHKRRKLGVEHEEVARWRAAAERMHLPHDMRLGVIPQDQTFTEHAVWDFAATAPDQYPLL